MKKLKTLNEKQLKKVVGGKMEPTGVGGYYIPGGGAWPSMKWSFNFKRWFRIQYLSSLYSV